MRRTLVRRHRGRRLIFALDILRGRAGWLTAERTGETRHFLCLEVTSR